MVVRSRTGSATGVPTPGGSRTALERGDAERHRCARAAAKAANPGSSRRPDLRATAVSGATVGKRAGSS